MEIPDAPLRDSLTTAPLVASWRQFFVSLAAFVQRSNRMVSLVLTTGGANDDLDIQNAGIVYLTQSGAPAGTVTIGGAVSAKDPKRRTIWVNATGSTVEFTEESGGSAAENRFAAHGGSAYQVTDGGVAESVWVPTVERYFVR